MSTGGRCNTGLVLARLGGTAIQLVTNTALRIGATLYVCGELKNSAMLLLM